MGNVTPKGSATKGQKKFTSGVFSQLAGGSKGGSGKGTPSKKPAKKRDGGGAA